MSVRRSIKTSLIVVIMMLFCSYNIYGDEIVENTVNLSCEETTKQEENCDDDTEKKDASKETDIDVQQPVVVIEKTEDDSSSICEENETDESKEAACEENETEDEESQEETVSEELIVIAGENDEEADAVIEEETGDNADETIADDTSNDASLTGNPLDEIAVVDVSAAENELLSGEDLSANYIKFTGEYTITEPVTSDNENIIIQSVELAQMPTNTDYSYLSFTFSSKDNDTVYECYIAGFKIGYVDSDSLEKGVKQLIYDIANSYYNNQDLYFGDNYYFVDLYKQHGIDINHSTYNDYGVIIDPIDAEKTHITASSPSNNGDYDSNLCWAASASDMIEFTGWNDSTDLSDEDALFDYFEESYTDTGSLQDVGNKWFMNGVSYRQYVTDSGEIEYGYGVTTSQEKLFNGNKNGNLVSDYAEELVGQETYIKSEEDYNQLYQSVMDIKNGNATGLGIYFCDDQGKLSGGHAITLSGYLKDTSKEGLDSLCALFISDSDNNKATTGTYGRSVLPNSFEMVELKRKVISNINGTFNTLGLDNYMSGIISASYNVPILTFATLKAKANAASAAEETQGTNNAVNTVDLVVSFIDVEDEEDNTLKTATEGDSVYLVGDFFNKSYAKYSLVNEPYFDYSFVIECDGQILDTITEEITITDFCSGYLNPLKKYYVYFDYVLPKAGTYKIYASINDFAYTADGVEYPVWEAYTSNNFSNFFYTLIVKAREVIYDNTGSNNNDDTVIAVSPVPVKRNYKKSVAVYTATIQSDKVNGNEVKLKNIKTKVASISLKNVGDIKGKYSIVYDKDGTATIKFDDEFISSLLPGVYTFNLYDESKTLIASVEVEINAQLTDTSEENSDVIENENIKAVEEAETVPIKANISVFSNIVNKIENFFKSIWQIFSK